jgi:molybdopterin adenylyltransferase
MAKKEHLKQAPIMVKIALITVSTTRTALEDKSGNWMKKQCEKEGHEIVDYRIVTDNRHEITKAVNSIMDAHGPDVILVNGGTGISSADVTIEAVKPMFVKEMSAFGILFATLSFQEIDSAAILSRAMAGVIGRTAVFCMPGSLNACKLACLELILPELRHVAAHLQN